MDSTTLASAVTELLAPYVSRALGKAAEAERIPVIYVNCD